MIRQFWNLAESMIKMMVNSLQMIDAHYEKMSQMKEILWDMTLNLSTLV